MQEKFEKYKGLVEKILLLIRLKYEGSNAPLPAYSSTGSATETVRPTAYSLCRY